MTFARTRLLTITTGMALTLVGCTSSSPSSQNTPSFAITQLILLCTNAFCSHL